MFCPNCHEEYPVSSETCSRCGVPLIAERPAESEPAIAYETADVTAAAAAEELLTEAGIPFVTEGEDVADLFPFAPGFNPVGEMRIEVPEERLDEAKALLEEGLDAAPLSEDADVGEPTPEV